ncbi:MAG: HAD family hydrolase [Clostridiales bacterium]|jgi:hydroxymethylpyrimidine pyrophosphatase-like HAD family hydrolase|nr:HAD family hydrolase [Clostridiales bacterium]
MALGDSENDITMLEYAGVSLAMHQSDDRVKTAARDIALPQNEDGFLKALIKYGVI